MGYHQLPRGSSGSHTRMSSQVGRTARMGRDGNALVYLLPHEESYVDFLHKRQVPLQLAAGEGDEAAEEEETAGAREVRRWVTLWARWV